MICPLNGSKSYVRVGQVVGEALLPLFTLPEFPGPPLSRALNRTLLLF